MEKKQKRGCLWDGDGGFSFFFSEMFADFLDGLLVEFIVEIMKGNYCGKGLSWDYRDFSGFHMKELRELDGMGWFFFKMLAIYNPHLTWIFSFMVRFPSEVVVIPNFDCFGPHILTVIANAWKSKTNVWSSRKQSFPVPIYF